MLLGRGNRVKVIALPGVAILPGKLLPSPFLGLVLGAGAYPCCGVIVPSSTAIQRYNSISHDCAACVTVPLGTAPYFTYRTASVSFPSQAVACPSFPGTATPFEQAPANLASNSPLPDIHAPFGKSLEVFHVLEALLGERPFHQQSDHFHHQRGESELVLTDPLRLIV